jgi:hypothetical protein
MPVAADLPMSQPQTIGPQRMSQRWEPQGVDRQREGNGPTMDGRATTPRAPSP